MGLIERTIIEVSHAQKENKLRERFNAGVVIVFSELLLRVFAEVIRVIQGQAAVVFLEGVNLVNLRLFSLRDG